MLKTFFEVAKFKTSSLFSLKMVHVIAQIFGRACTVGRDTCPKPEPKKSEKLLEGCFAKVIKYLNFNF